MPFWPLELPLTNWRGESRTAHLDHRPYGNIPLTGMGCVCKSNNYSQKKKTPPQNSGWYTAAPPLSPPVLLTGPSRSSSQCDICTLCFVRVYVRTCVNFSLPHVLTASGLVLSRAPWLARRPAWCPGVLSARMRKPPCFLCSWVFFVFVFFPPACAPCMCSLRASSLGYKVSFDL